MKMTIPQYAEWAKKLGPRMRAAIDRGLRSGGMRAVTIMHKATENAPPASPNGRNGAVDNGEYKRRWQYKAIPNGILVYNDAPYADIIEHGRRPGAAFPPRGPIRRFAIRKLGVSEEQADAVAFLIAAKIAERGLKPRLVLTNARDALVKAFIEEIQRELTRELHGK